MSPLERITCFLVPKPFAGHAGLIQENALRCLRALGMPVLVMGDEEGVSSTAARYGARHLPEIPRNEQGTPRVDGAFELARRSAETPYLCYLNADILLPRDFLARVMPLLDRAPRALFVGRRWNLEITESLAFDDVGWQALEDRRIREGLCPGPAAMDYFLFPRDAFLEMPAFAIGRPGWDNWMVHEAKGEGRPVVDLSPIVAVVHQNHDFNHLPGGEADYRNGAESLANRHLAGGYFHLLNLEDATHLATEGGLKRRWRRPSIHLLSRWVLGLTTRTPRLREGLRTLKRALLRKTQSRPGSGEAFQTVRLNRSALPQPAQEDEGRTLPLDPNTTRHLSRRPQESGLAKFPLPDWDHFEPLAFLGEGGMGRVFKARDPRLNRLVALKFIRGDDEDLLRRFQVEARSQALIEHPHVCKVYEVGEEKGQAYIAMQFIEGRSLDEAAPELNLEEKVRIVLKVAEAIHAAHRQGIIHRDLKPANIMLERSEQGRWWPYVMDFGLARGSEGAGMTQSGIAVGTPSFMPPEQALGHASEIDRRSDVYSLGATLYDLLVGEPPFRGTSITELFFKVVHEEAPSLRRQIPSIPGDLETIVLKCLEKEAQRRYDSAKALADDLRRFLDGEAIQARPASVIYRLKKKVRKNRSLSAAILLSAVLGLGFASWGVRATVQARRQAQLANRFALEVKAIEDTMRVAHLRPLHDVRPEKHKVRARMARLREEMAQQGSVAAGPGGHALGLGHMALGEVREARMAFQTAWDAGYRPPQLGMALGQALAAEYETGRLLALQLPKEEQDARLADLNGRLLAPATELLRVHLGRTRAARMPAVPGYAYAGTLEEPVEGAGYLEALLLHLQGREDEAIRKARVAFLQDPGVYGAKRLEAQAFMALAQKARNAGDLGQAAAQLEEAGQALLEARELARSDGSLWRWEAERRMALAALGAGRDPLPALEKAFQWGIAACDRALACDPDDVEAMRRSAEAWHDMATYQLDGGRDNLPALERAKDLLDRALALKTEEGELWYLLGRVGYATARTLDRRGTGSVEAYTQAVRAYQEAQARGREASERSALACLFKAFFQDAHGADPGPSFLEAETLIRRARAFREDRFSLNTMGLVLAAQGRWRMARGETADLLLAEARACFTTGYERYHAFASLRNLADVGLLEALHEETQGRDPKAALEKARITILEALKVGPTYFLSHLTLGEVHLRLARIAAPEARAQDLKESRQALEQAIRLNPSDPVAYQRLAEGSLLAAATGTPEGLSQAEAALEAARAKAGQDAGWWTRRADLLRARALATTASTRAAVLCEGILAAERAVALNPRASEAWALMGVLRKETEEPGKAEDALRKAFEFDATLKLRYHR
jgi:serine/threonine protein kinase/tetratricopeptide (TPR) repeat protein